MPHAIVISAGPSLDPTKVPWDCGSPVVAVNSAIARVQRADIWMSLDPPNDVLRGVFGAFLALPMRPIHRMSASYSPAWLQEFGTWEQLARDNQMPFLPGAPPERPLGYYVQDPCTHDWVKIPWLAALLNRIARNTIFAAIAHPIERWKSTEIDIYGVTMKGTDYCHEATTVAARRLTSDANRDAEAKRRWEREREAMRFLVQECGRNHVAVRVHP